LCLPPECLFWRQLFLRTFLAIFYLEFYMTEINGLWKILKPLSFQTSNSFDYRNTARKNDFSIWIKEQHRQNYIYYLGKWPLWMALVYGVSSLYIKSLFIRYNLDEMSVWMAQDELNKE
jgi:hypothetical protein